MKAKILLLILILLSFSAVGCVGDDETPDAAEVLNGTTDEVVNETVVNETVVEETVVEETVVEENVSEGKEGIEVIEYEGAKTYTVYMENFLTQPSNLTINEGDSVMWFNRNSPTRIFTLVSNEGLWENVSIGYRLSFTYNFTEPGTYTYKVLGWEGRMAGTINVK